MTLGISDGNTTVLFLARIVMVFNVSNYHEMVFTVPLRSNCPQPACSLEGNDCNLLLYYFRGGQNDCNFLLYPTKKCFSRILGLKLFGCPAGCGPTRYGVMKNVMIARKSLKLYF